MCLARASAYFTDIKQRRGVIKRLIEPYLSASHFELSGGFEWTEDAAVRYHQGETRTVSGICELDTSRHGSRCGRRVETRSAKRMV